MRYGPTRSIIARRTGSDFLRWFRALRMGQPIAHHLTSSTSHSRLGKNPRVELKRLAQMRKEVVRGVGSGVEMEFMGNAFRQKFLMKLGRTFLKAEVILLAAVDIDRQSFQLRPVLAG